VSSLLQVLQFTKGWNAVESAAAADKARALAEKNNNLAELVLQVFRSWAGVISSADFTAAIALADQLLDLAEREGSAAKLGLAHVSQVNTRYFSGDLLGAEEMFSRGSAFFSAAQKEPGLSVMVYGFASHNAWMLGFADTALDRMERELDTARMMESPFQLAFAQFVAALLRLYLRQPEQAKSLAEDSIALSDQHGFSYIGIFSRMARGRALANLGGANEGVSLIRNGIGALPETDRNGSTLFLSWLAEAQALNCEISDALATIEQALEANVQERAWRGNARAIRARLRLSLGQNGLAEADFREAIASAQKIGAKALELSAVMSLVRMLRDRGDLAKARDLLAPLYSSFTEGFGTPDLKDAKALLAELGH
jgi:tetratricopeptide (TPR) repeat protein